MAMRIDDEKQEDASSTIDDVRRICGKRLEELKIRSMEIEETAKRAAMQRAAIQEEVNQIERVLEATKGLPVHRDFNIVRAPDTLVQGNAFGGWPGEGGRA